MYSDGLSAIASARCRADLRDPPSHQRDASAHQDGMTDKTQAGEGSPGLLIRTRFCTRYRSAALAATKTHSIAPSQDGYTVYNPARAVSAPNRVSTIRFQLNRDWDTDLSEFGERSGVRAGRIGRSVKTPASLTAEQHCALALLASVGLNGASQASLMARGRS